MRSIRCILRHKWETTGKVFYYATLESEAFKLYQRCSACGERRVETDITKHPRPWEDKGILPSDAIKGEGK